MTEIYLHVQQEKCAHLEVRTLLPSSRNLGLGDHMHHRLFELLHAVTQASLLVLRVLEGTVPFLHLRFQRVDV